MRILILLFFNLNFLTAQKVVKKSLVDSAVSSFQIDASNCFKINIETTATDEVVVEAFIDGEYSKDLVLNLTQEGATVAVSAGFQPNFKNPNDKLSAHKVVSIALDIMLPANKVVKVYGLSCNVIINGSYEELNVILNDGTCDLSEVSGLVEVTTQSGNISATSDTATSISTSKYGTVNGELTSNGSDTYKLSTITGNILLKRIE